MESSFFNCVKAAPIPQCLTINSLDSSKCDVCVDGFSLTQDHSACLSCDSFSKGCKTCSTSKLDGLWKVTSCNTCAFGLNKLTDTKCSLPNCFSFTVDLTWTAKCNVCNDGYGILQSGQCYTCAAQTNCACCTFLTSTTNIDKCTICKPGRVLDSGTCSWP